VSEVSTISIDDIFTVHQIESCKLLKVDIEGSEYDAFSTFSNIDKVENISIELHRCGAAKKFDVKKAITSNKINIVCEFISEGNKLV